MISPQVRSVFFRLITPALPRTPGARCQLGGATAALGRLEKLGKLGIFNHLLLTLLWIFQ